MAQSMHDYVVGSLKAYRGELEQIEDATGVSKWTLLKILQRQIENPGVKSIEILNAYFRRRDKRRNGQRQAA